MVFILQFVNVMYYSDLYMYIDESLHPWDKSHLIMVYDQVSLWFKKYSVGEICPCPYARPIAFSFPPR